jgi:hypothetical protein
MKIALLLLAAENNLLSETGGKRRLLRLLEQPLQVVQIAVEKADSLRLRPWDHKALWNEFGAYLNRYQPPAYQRPLTFQQRKRGYTDKGSAASVSIRGRRAANEEGSIRLVLDQLTFYSTEYEERESERWFDLLAAGALYCSLEESGT